MTVDPVKKTHVKLNDILTVLGIAVLAIPVAGPELDAAVTAGTEAGILILKAIKQAPGIAQAIWPVGTVDSQDVQFDVLTSELDRISLGLMANLQVALQIVQGLAQPVSSFLAFASNGSFAVPLSSRPSVLGLMISILEPLKTYLTSVALSNNGWHIVLLPSVNPQGVSNRSTPCPSWAESACEKSPDLKCEGYDSNSQCINSYWWYSASQNAAYTLNHNDNLDSTQLIGSILNNSWSTGASLFEDAAICEVQNAIQQSLPAIYTTYSGRSGFSFNGSFGNLQGDDVRSLSNGTTFLPFDGSGLSTLSQDPTAKLHHPDGTENGTIWQNFGPQGFDFRCTSQLNVTIAYDWNNL